MRPSGRDFKRGVEMSNELQLTSGGRYGHIDAMRALAVLLVVVAHAGLGHIVPGGSGVTIFFAISGFIITHLVLKEHARTGGFNVGRFYLRRLLKLAPPFVVIIAVPTAIYSIWHPVVLTDFLAQVFFVFNWIYMAGDQQVLPGSAVVWSLAVEEQFYIGFALLWLWLVKSPSRVQWLAWLAIVVAVASLGVRIYIAETAFSHNRIYYGTDTRIDGIAIGVLFAVIFFWMERTSRHSARVRKLLGSDWLVPLALGGYLFSLLYRDEYFRETYRYSMQAISAGLMVLYGLIQRDSRLRKVMQRAMNISVVQAIGLASYSIYLVHLSWNSLVRGLVSDWPEPLAITFVAVTGVAVGILLWRFVEVPVERYKKRLESRVDIRVVAPAAGG